MTESPAQRLARKQNERAAAGRSENIADLLERMEYAHDWLAAQSARHDRESQEATSEWYRGYTRGFASAQRDAAGMIASFVKSLDQALDALRVIQGTDDAEEAA